MARAHQTRAGLAWSSVRDRLWFVPSLAAVGAMALAVGAVAIPTPQTGSAFAQTWLFGASAEGARGVLSAIATSLITVTGVVFSVTIVALQLASSQFTPRVLRSFTADRVNQAVLGVFIGTFTYTLLVLRTIRSTGEDGRAADVPQVAVTLALALLLVSVGALIVFINHMAQSIQEPVILHRESTRTVERLDVLFPEHVGRRDDGAGTDQEWECPDEPCTAITAAESGYLQSVDGEALWRSGRQERLTMRMEVRLGAFAFPGKPLVSVWPAHLGQDPDVVTAVRRAFVLGTERTPEQDLEYGIVAISDVAIKALSPSVNDPTTAMHCIDRLTEVLGALASRRHPDLRRQSPDGRVRLMVQDTPLERALGVAFDQIRHFGANNPAIANKLLAAVIDLCNVVPGEDRHVLAAQASAVLRAARREIDDPGDLAGVEQLADEARSAASGFSEPTARVHSSRITR